MKLNSCFATAAGLCSVLFFAVNAQAGPPVPACDVTIEINALRGGSPTTPFGPGATKKITAKARIAKGTGPADQTLENTTLTIEAFQRGGHLISSTTAPDLLTLIVGKGGTGTSVDAPVPTCLGGFIRFFATFSGTSSTTGGTCTRRRGPLLRECQ